MAMGTALLLPWACLQGVVAAPATVSPSGLLVNFQSSPALGIPLGQRPQFSWVVPGGHTAGHVQTSYRLIVTDAHRSLPVKWDSGVVHGNQSIAVPYGGGSLAPGTAYNWTVQTTTANKAIKGSVHTSDASEPATFVTALQSFDTGASYIWSNSSAGIFAFFRKTVKQPSTRVLRATAFVTAVTDDYMLCGYKLYLGGQLVGVGPGRGEAVVWGGNGTYMKRPYATYDVTNFIPATGDLLIAVASLVSHHMLWNFTGLLVPLLASLLKKIVAGLGGGQKEPWKRRGLRWPLRRRWPGHGPRIPDAAGTAN